MTQPVCASGQFDPHYGMHGCNRISGMKYSIGKQNLSNEDRFRFGGSIPTRIPNEKWHFSKTPGAKRSRYQVLHDDRSRGFIIDRSLIADDLPIVDIGSPASPTTERIFFDYMMLLERARCRIHCIPSSFFCIIEADAIPRRDRSPPP